MKFGEPSDDEPPVDPQSYKKESVAGEPEELGAAESPVEENEDMKDLPTVSREAQQALKSTNSKVKASDGGEPEAPQKPKPKAKAKGKANPSSKAKAKASMKRPATRGKVQAEPVAAVPVDISDVEVASPVEALKEKFEAVTDGKKQKEVKKPGEGAEGAKRKKQAQKENGSEKETTPEPPTKKSKKGAAVEPEPKTTGKTDAAAEPEAKSGKKPREAEPKSTFAGRRRPATEGARSRFDAMKDVFDNEISHKLSVNVGTAEDRNLKAFNYVLLFRFI